MSTTTSVSSFTSILLVVVVIVVAASTVVVSAFDTQHHTRIIAPPLFGDVTSGHTNDDIRRRIRLQGTATRSPRTGVAAFPNKWKNVIISPTTTTTSRLYAAIGNNDNGVVDDDNDGDIVNNGKSKRTVLFRRLKFWTKSATDNSNNRQQQQQNNNNNNNNTGRNRRKVAKLVATSLASSAGIMSAVVATNGGSSNGNVPAAVHALTQEDMIEQNTKIYSLRPGVSKEQAERLLDGDMPDEVRDQIDAKSSIGTTTGMNKEDAIKKAKKGDLYGQDLDDAYDDDEYAVDEYTFGDERSGSGTVLDPRKQRAKASGSFGSGATKTDVSSEISKQSKVGAFSGGSDHKATMVYVKVAVACFLPTFGFFGVRDFVRNRKEEKNVIKGIEIMDAQRAEYFGIDKDGKNITNSDIEDELKDLKDDDDDDDDDDEDNDDDDDDDDNDTDDDDTDDDEPPRRKRRSLPKGPTGDGDGGVGGIGGGDDDGFGAPSEDDVKKLGDIFKNS